MTVAARNRGDAQAEELVLRILRHDARVAHAVELDALALLPGVRDGLRRTLQRHGAGRVAVLQEGRHGVVHHLHQHITRLVVHVHTAVDEGHALAHAASQLELEVGQPVVAHAAAKAHHGGLAHMGALGQLAHGQAGKGAGVGQHQLGHALLCRGQGTQGCGDAFKHGHSCVGKSGGRCHGPGASKKAGGRWARGAWGSQAGVI